LERANRKSLQREAKAQEERDRIRLDPDTESEEEAVQQIGGSRAPPPPPYTSRPLPTTPRRSGVLQYSFKGNASYPEEIASVRAGAVVTEVIGGGDWTLIETANGTRGKVPTDFVSWKVSERKPPQPPPHEPMPELPTPLPVVRTKRRKLIAVQDFLTKDSWAVSLVREEVVKEIEADKDGWTMVKKKDGTEGWKDGSRGLVPSAFLKDALASPQAVQQRPPVLNSPPLRTLPRDLKQAIIQHPGRRPVTRDSLTDRMKDHLAERRRVVAGVTLSDTIPYASTVASDDEA